MQKKVFEHACAIVTQAWSASCTGSPGKGNWVLATVAEELVSQYYPIHLVAQAEVSDALHKAHWCVDPPKGVTLGRSSADWNTYTVALKQAERLRGIGVEKGATIIVVAHPVHMRRALAVYRKLGFNPVPAEMPKDGYGDPKAKHFVARGEEWWRKPIIYAREWLATLMFWWKGYI